jgi:hypothetical protein
MDAAVQDKFEERRQKVKNNILSDVEEYYGDPLEWKEVSTDLVKFGIFYSRSCEQWLKSIFLYGYDVASFAERFLKPSTKAILDKGRLQKHHYSLLSQYAIDRSVVELLLTGKFDPISMQRASDYHDNYLKVNNYSDVLDVVKKMDDIESMLSTIVPKMIVDKLLNVDHSAVIESVDLALKSREKIWMYAWQLLYRLYASEKSGLEACWSDLVKEWKNCFIKSDFHAFNNSYLVLLYYLYCQGIVQSFDIRHLSEEILKA